MKKRYLILLSIILATILLFILTLFPKEDSGKIKQTGPIPVIFKESSLEPFDFWSMVTRGIEESATDYGIEFYIIGPPLETDIDKQMEIVDLIIEKNPPLIILAAGEYEKLVPLVEKADESGIPVITLDSGVNSTIPVSFIATDNLEAGQKVGYTMSELLKNSKSKKIAIISYIRGTATAIDREAGVMDSTKELTLLKTLYCDGERDIAYEMTLDLLDTHKDLAGIIALNEPTSLGVAQAISETGKKDFVVVVGFDNAPEELEYLEQGVIKAIVIQKPFNMGYLSIKTAYEYLKGESVKPFINTGSLLVTSDNMYSKEFQEALFPF